ncbi:MAG: hypothetical protein K6E69_00425 [Treponema sp.]|uniref:hypothetical protein n=1 Tax=Treponema sp. TaxID=166 RepID=UPI00298D6D82|nr:hypothetical protein [Treponema sp.]MCR5385564.1 hypothetical protein [Treponema sp.]
MNEKKNVLIISYSPLHRDPRILRQIQALKDDYNIQTLGSTSPNVDDVDFFWIPDMPKCQNMFQKIHLGLQIVFRKYKKVLSRNLNIETLLSYKYKKPDCIFANDWNGLYCAYMLKKQNNWSCRIYFDAHEYFPAYRNTIRWKIFERPLVNYALHLCRKQITYMTSVCPTLARMYEKYFKFDKGFVKIILNAPDYEKDLVPTRISEKIQIIHHGGAMRERQLEKMIDMMKYLPADKYELTFMLVKNDASYYETLVQRASKFSNIKFHDPVPFNEIPSFINMFDLGVYILDTEIINHRYALPNKFFEFVQARLAIAIGSSPEMRDYTKKYNLGVSARSNQPKDLAEEILKLSKEDIMLFKENSNKYAEELSAKKNVFDLKKIADMIIK